MDSWAGTEERKEVAGMLVYLCLAIGKPGPSLSSPYSLVLPRMRSINA